MQAPARVGLRSSRSEKWKKEAFTLFREVQSEKNMLSLFFEKCKVKKICFHSFSRSEKWNQNASRPRSRSENSREFLTILEKRDFTTELLDKEEEVADFQDDFTHIGVSIDCTGRADDLEEDLDEAEYEDVDDMEGKSEE